MLPSVFAGNSVWSTSERLVVEVLMIGAIQVHFPFLSFPLWVSLYETAKTFIRYRNKEYKYHLETRKLPVFLLTHEPWAQEVDTWHYKPSNISVTKICDRDLRLRPPWKRSAGGPGGASNVGFDLYRRSADSENVNA